LGGLGGFRGHNGGLRSTETVNRLFSGTVLREYDQTFAVEIQVDQREAGAQSVVVFRQTPVADLVEYEEAFQDAERMFYLGLHARLTPVLCTLVTRPRDPCIWFSYTPYPEPSVRLL
jgi:hypothetical protein